MHPQESTVTLPFSRRTLLRMSAAGVAGIALAAQARPAAADIGDVLTLPIPDMDPYDIATLDRSLFTPQEQRITQYFVSLADIANNMEDTDPETVGWFNGGYSAYAPDPWNARNQESVYTLAFFYTHEADWNPYYLDPVLRDHVYAAMRYYLQLQGPEGWWPAYSYTDKNRAATGFGLIYLGEAAVKMEEVGWDPQVRAEVLASLQLGAEYLLDPTVADVWDAGMRYVNQIIGGMTGISAFLHLMPAHIEASYHERLDFLMANGQSQGAGYMYEYAAFDAHYSLYTALRDLAVAYERTGDDRYRQIALKHLDWCQYNYLWEPDGAGWTVNGISSRTSMRSLAALREADTSNYPDHLNVFNESHVVRALNWPAEHLAELQQAWADGEVDVTRLSAGGTAPQNLRLTVDEPVYPTVAEREAAIASFPYMGSDSFVEARTDERFDAHYVFTKRVGYYFATHHGRALSPRVVRGPSFFYHHATGAFVATQMGTGSAWTTILADGYTDASASTVQTGGRYHQSLPFTYTYADAGDRIHRTFRCLPECVRIVVDAPAETSFTERVPLVVGPSDTVSFLVGDAEVLVDGAGSAVARGVRIRRGDSTFDLMIGDGGAVDLSLTPTAVTLFGGDQRRVITDLDISSGAASLTYKLQIRP
ncbi:hypothetical protein [Occultella kanbiaonis]|uniref:hypothetical protein n=1 Tax=Occultella kanbiaonis TaxID=2675754 RepID=UPI0012B74C1B|nr:hypothetical protein [Occultella kanbiaonis]